MITSRIVLDGTWEFRRSADGDGAGDSRPIRVPGPWQAQFPDLRMKGGIGWYRREILLPQGWLKGEIRLCFGAVFHSAEVWVNGIHVGRHEGGFLPFACAVGHSLVDSRSNEILVRVSSPDDDPERFPEMPLAEIPFGKQSWYGPLSGIWQPVHLERRDIDHVEHVRIRADLRTGRVGADIRLAGPLTRPLEVEVAVRDPSGELVAAVIAVPASGAPGLDVSMVVPDVRPWSPDEPRLYRLVVSLRDASGLVDQVVESFGFRTFETRGGRFHLNGEPFYLRGALDQDYYPDTICTPPSLEFLEDQFRKAKQLGLNCLRCHIKVPDPRYYEVADRLGMLIWAELPNGGQLTPRSRARAEATLRGMLERDGNHPSIVCWTIINENWGVDLVHDPEHRAWLARTVAWLKAHDPTRLVVDNSPTFPDMHVRTDIADYHHYSAIPDQREDWDRFVGHLAGRPDWLFSRFGDAMTTGDEPLVCSEFGNWGLPHPEDLADAEGREPWWFEDGHDWGDGVMYPHGLEHRFAGWSLDRVFGSLRGFVEAAQWQQFHALKYQIEQMRREPALAGYVITELTDCHWESNGLLDMRRNPRVFHELFRTVNADTVIAPRWERLSFWAGETARLGVAVAHGAGPPLAGAVLTIVLDRAVTVLVPHLEAGSVAELGPIKLAVPEAAVADLRPVAFELRGPDGALLATNRLDLAVHPRRPDPAPVSGPIWSPSVRLRDRLLHLGYPLAPDLAAAKLVVATTPDEDVAAFVRAGGRLLLLPEDEGSLAPFFPQWQHVRVRSRHGTVWWGNWASSFAWLRRDGRFAGLPGGPLLDATFDRVLPTEVITGCNRLDFQARVHAGMVVGWVHKAVALAVERDYGAGRLVVATFRLFRDPPGADPTATMLLDELVALALRPAGRRQEPEVEKVPGEVPTLATATPLEPEITPAE